MAQLPRYAAFKSKYNNNYLRYVNEPSEVQKFVQYSEESILTPYTKYELQPADSDPTLVNIRCCYNNKYWVSWPSNNSYIVAGADKTEEHKSKWNCTLFQPLYDNTHQAFRFRHLYRDSNVCLQRVDNSPFCNCLTVRSSVPDKDLGDLSTIIDWGTLLSIPKYVAFKGDNNCYLSGRWIDGHHYLQFSSEDSGDPTVEMEAFITKDGSIRLKSNYLEKFWRRSSPNWIWADSTDTTTDNLDTLFSPTKVDTNVLALRNLGNNNFVKRLSFGGKTSCLNAAVNTMDMYSQLEFQELVLSREISNVKFCVLDSMIYVESVNEMDTQSATNTTHVPNTVNLNFTYTYTKSSTWNSSVSVKLLGVKTTMETEAPLIFGGIVEIVNGFSGAYQWGETKTTSRLLRVPYKVTVPPMTSTIVTLMATTGTCEVPYSYTQRDTLLNGKIKTYQMDDGIYRGINSYNFTHTTKNKSLAT